MKKEFIKPLVQVFPFNVSDIITGSLIPNPQDPDEILNKKAWDIYAK